MFADRDAPRDSFISAVEAVADAARVAPARARILQFYGIGKTKLLRELQATHAEARNRPRVTQ